jgi:hypothetical protein
MRNPRDIVAFLFGVLGGSLVISGLLTGRLMFAVVGGVFALVSLVVGTGEGGAS